MRQQPWKRVSEGERAVRLLGRQPLGWLMELQLGAVPESSRADVTATCPRAGRLTAPQGPFRASTPVFRFSENVRKIGFMLWERPWA